MSKLTDIRPKLKQDAVFLQTATGVYFPGEGTPFLLKGHSVTHWLSRLSHHMNGQHTLEDLCEGLTPEQRNTLIQLVHTLMQKGLVKNYISEDSQLLSQEVRRYFRPQIEYIDHYVDSPLQRFKTFRESRLLLLGSGEAYAVLAQALIRNGVQELFLAPGDDIERYYPLLEPGITSLHKRGIDVALSPISVQHEGLPECLDEYDMVVYCSEQGQPKELLALQKRCLQAKKRFLSAMVWSEHALLGPLAAAEGGPCWLCAQLRITANLPDHASAALWRALALGAPLATAESTHCTVSVARCLGNTLGFELFKILSGAMLPETQNGVIIQHLETLESTRSHLLVHPLCPVCSQSSEELARAQLEAVVKGERDDILPPDQVHKRTSLLVDERAGVFKVFDDEDLPQLPLKVTTLIAPPPAFSHSTHVTVAGYSIENLLDARNAALQTMTEHYLRTLPDARQMRFASLRELQAQEQRALAPQELATASGLPAFSAETRIAWLPAYALYSQQICYIPAAAAYPHSELNRSGHFERTQVGLATAPTFSSLLTEGITSALGYEHLRALLRGRRTLMNLQPDSATTTDNDLTFLWQCVKRAQHNITVFAVAGTAPIHLVIAQTTDPHNGPRRTTLGSGLSRSSALKRALLAMIGDLQLLAAGKLPPPTQTTLFPAFSLDGASLMAEPAHSHAEPPPATGEALQEHLRASQREVFFIHMTPADLWKYETCIGGLVLLDKGEIVQ